MRLRKRGTPFKLCDFGVVVPEESTYHNLMWLSMKPMTKRMEEGPTQPLTPLDALLFSLDLSWTICIPIPKNHS